MLTNKLTPVKPSWLGNGWSTQNPQSCFVGQEEEYCLLRPRSADGGKLRVLVLVILGLTLAGWVVAETTPLARAQQLQIELYSTLLKGDADGASGILAQLNELAKQGFLRVFSAEDELRIQALLKNTGLLSDPGQIKEVFEAHKGDATLVDAREKFVLWKTSVLYNRRRDLLAAPASASQESRDFLVVVLDSLSFDESQEDKAYAFDREAQRFLSTYPGSDHASVVATYLKKDIRYFAVKVRFGASALFGGDEIGASNGPHPGFDLGCQITTPEPNLSYVLSFGTFFYGQLGRDSSITGAPYYSGHSLVLDDFSLQIGYPFYFPVGSLVPLLGLSLVGFQDQPPGQGHGSTVYSPFVTVALEANGLEPKVQVLDAPNFFELSLMGGVYLPTNSSDPVLATVRPFVKFNLSLGPKYLVLAGQGSPSTSPF